MADQTKEQLVIEAVLTDLVSSQAGKIVEALKKSNAELEKSAKSSGASKVPDAVGQGLTKLVPIARRAGGELVSMAGDLGKFGNVAVGSLREAGNVLQEIGIGAGAAGTSLLTIGATVTGIAAVGTVLGIAAKNAYELDKSFNVVRISQNLTKQGEEELTEAIKQWRTEGISAEQGSNTLAAAARFLTKELQDQKAAAESVFKAFKVDVGQSAPEQLMRSTAEAVKAFGLSAKDTDRVLGTLFAVSSKTGDGMVQVANALTQLAPHATVAKVSLEDVAAALAANADRAGGLSDAATGLRQLLIGLSKPTSELGSDLRAFGVDTTVGANGVRDLHSILAQIGDLAKQDGGVIEVLSGGSKEGAKVFAGAAESAKEYDDILRSVASGTADLREKTEKFSKVASEEMSRALGKLAVAGESFLDGVLMPIKDIAVAVTGSWTEGADEAVKKTDELGGAVERVARSAAKLDLDSPLAKTIRDVSARMDPVQIKVELDPSTKKTLAQDLVTLQAALGNLPALKAGKPDPRALEALTRVAQLMVTIENAEAFSADLAIKAASGYEKQRLELEAADKALARTAARQSLGGLKGAGFLAAAKAATDEMRRSVTARNQIEGMTLQNQVLQAQRQQLTAEMELARARGDSVAAAQLVIQIDELDGQAIEQNAARARAANVEQYRGRADLLQLAQDATDAAKEEAKAKRESAFIDAQRAFAASELAHAMRPGAQRLDEVLNERALDLATRKVMTLQEAVLTVRRTAEGIGEGFKQGMDEALRVYSDSATRMMEASRSLFESIHDEGARSMADLFKGNLSGGDALRQFGQGVLGGIADQGSSLIMDQFMGGLFGLGHGGDNVRDVSMRANNVNLVTGSVSALSGLFGGGAASGGLLGGLLGGIGLPFFADGGIASGPQLAMVGDNSSRHEAIVPLPGAGRGIPVEFRGGGRGGVTINHNPTVNVSLTVHSVDPRGAAQVVLAQMPQIQRAIASALVRGSDRQLRDAVQGAVR